MILSIIIPTKDENENLLRLLKKNPYVNKSDYEIIIADGNEKEPAVETFIGDTFTNVQIILNPEKYTPNGINLALKCSSGKYILLCGARSFMNASYAETCIEILEKNSAIACVGGRIIHRGCSDKGKAIAKAMSIPLGMGLNSFRSRKKSGYVDTVSVPVFRKSIFTEIGLFDETFIRNQDDDFSYRIRRAGYKIFLDQNIWSEYFSRENYSQLAHQFYQYGFWKPYLLKKHKSISTIRQLAPMIVYTTFIVGIFLSYNQASAYPLLPLFIYIIIILITGTIAAHNSLISSLRVMVALVAMHINYAAGYIIGLFYAFLMSPNKPSFSKTLTR